MDKREAEELKDLIREVLAERSTVDTQTHKEHHLFLDECIPLLRDFLAYRAEKMLQRKRKEAALQKIKETAIGSVVVACVGGVVYALQWIGHAVIVAIQSGGHP